MNTFKICESNGSKTQIPSLRVRDSDTGVTIALVRAKRSKLAQWIRNNPMSDERKELERQLYEQGYTKEDLLKILQK